MDKFFDCIIIGGGPAGITAGIYAKRAGLSTLIIEKSEHMGGQVYLTNEILNYTGYDKISGQDLTKQMVKGLEINDVKVVNEEVIETNLLGVQKQVKTDKNEYKCNVVIIASGTAVKKLGAENEFKFAGKGVVYTTSNNEQLFVNKNVMVIGGGNSALEDAIYASKFASKVYLLHRRNEFRGEQANVNAVKQINNIQLLTPDIAISFNGKHKIESVTIKNINTNSENLIQVDQVVVSIGRGADTDFIDEVVARNQQGYIIVNENMQTNIDGVYACGDIRNTPLRQIVCATGDGAIAGISAFKYISKLNGTLYV